MPAKNEKIGRKEKRGQVLTLDIVAVRFIAQDENE